MCVRVWIVDGVGKEASSRSDWIRKIYADGRRYREITPGIRGSFPPDISIAFFRVRPTFDRTIILTAPSLPYTTHAADYPLLFHICSRESLSPVLPPFFYFVSPLFPPRFFFVSVFARLTLECAATSPLAAASTSKNLNQRHLCSLNRSVEMCI